MTLTGFTVLALLEAIEPNVPNGKVDVPSSKYVYCSEVKMYLFHKVLSIQVTFYSTTLSIHLTLIVLDSDKGKQCIIESWIWLLVPQATLDKY